MRIKNIIKNNYIFFTLSIIQVVISFFTDRVIFNAELCNTSRYYLYKMIFFSVLLVFWHYFIKLINSIRLKNTKVIYCVKCFIVYWIIMTVFMVLLWPGNWREDENIILGEAVTWLELCAWQHILTSLWYILSMMLFPSPFMVVVVEYTIISVIVGYVIGELIFKFGKKSLFFGIIFLFPSLIAHNLYPMRICLYAYLVFLFIYILFFKNDYKYSKDKLFLLILLSVLISSWRTEGILFILCFPAILIFKEKRFAMKNIIACVLTISLSLGSIGIQNYYLSMANQNSNSYMLTGFLLPLSELIKAENKNNPDGELMTKLRDEIDVDMILNSKNGEDAFWDGAFDNMKTTEQYNNIKQIYSKLLKKYPKIFINERIDTFLNSTIINYNKYDKERHLRSGLLAECWGSKVLSFKLRNFVIKMLEGQTNNNIYNNIIGIFYCPAISAVLLFIVWIKYLILIKKNKMKFYLVSYLMLQFFAVFLTAPGYYFMYYLSTFICGYFLFIYEFLLKNLVKTPLKNQI
ncbi:MAG: hypothetical protein MJ089_03310 [Ruminococcus sp.]|nr:hypothetical protein [Ruminococcus sp.]